MKVPGPVGACTHIHIPRVHTCHGGVLNSLLPHGSRVPLVYPLRTTYLMLHLFRIHAKGPDTCNLHASE